MEMLLGAMVMALLAKAIPAAVVDAVTMLRASKAGEWGLIDKERSRRHARSEGRRQAMSQAWGKARADRHRKAGGDGKYRPGAAAYFGDLYHGFWEDALEKRTVRRGGRPPNRYDRAVAEKVQRQRRSSGLFGRVARSLIDPVGERRQPADVVPPRSDGRGYAGSAGVPVDPWPFDGDEPTVNLAADEPADTPAPVPAGGPTVYERVLATALAAVEKADPTGRGGVEMRDRAFADVYNAHPGVDLDVIDAALAQADQDNRALAAHKKALDEQPTATDRNTARPTAEMVDGQVSHEARASREQNTTDSNNPTSNGGKNMSTQTGSTDMVRFNEAVAEHEAQLAALGEQLAQAVAVDQHLAGVVGGVEEMDGNRDRIAKGLASLAEGMEGSRFGAAASEGSANAAAAMSAGAIGAVQEHIEAAKAQNDQWKEALSNQMDEVQASLQHLKSTYGEAAATIQETGVNARALEED